MRQRDRINELQNDLESLRVLYGKALQELVAKTQEIDMLRDQLAEKICVGERR